MMDDRVLVKVENVSKKFCRNLRRSLAYGAKDIAREMIGSTGSRSHLRQDEFWALRDVSFQVRRGEMLGLIGQNGAGKSTLLKLLNGLIRPDTGRITVRGRMQALIELGAGFSPILTGRENVYVNAAVLGIPKAHVDRTLPDIVEFAGIQEFMDSPVQSYSSGMKARLGFAVVTQLDPDIMLVDEVLAVGDTAFQEKCMRRMDVLRQSDKAIIFVTHSLFQVEALCNKALWLDRGRIVDYGDAGRVVRAYLDEQERRAMDESRLEGVEYHGRGTTATRAYLQMGGSRGDGPAPENAPDPEELIQIRNVELVDREGQVRDEFPFLSDLTVRIHYHAARAVRRPLFNLRVFHKDRSILEAAMLVDGPGPESVEGDGVVECIIPRLPLTPKAYSIVLFVRSAEGVCDVTAMRTVAYFRVTDEYLDQVPLEGPLAVNQLRQGPPVYVSRTWRFYSGGNDRPIGPDRSGMSHEA